MPHIRFNWVDILFVTLLIRIGYVAFRSGVVSEFLRFFGLLSAFIVSFNHYTALSSFLIARSKWTGAKPDAISFLFLFLGILFIFKIATIVSMIFTKEDVSKFNKIGGLVFGFGRGLLLIALIYTLLISGPFDYLSKSAEEKSFSGRYVSEIAPFTYAACMKFYPGGDNKTPLAALLK